MTPIINICVIHELLKVTLILTYFKYFVANSINIEIPIKNQISQKMF